MQQGQVLTVVGRKLEIRFHDGIGGQGFVDPLSQGFQTFPGLCRYADAWGAGGEFAPFPRFKQVDLVPDVQPGRGRYAQVFQ
jgi:hypothetical protein